MSTRIEFGTNGFSVVESVEERYQYPEGRFTFWPRKIKDVTYSVQLKGQWDTGAGCGWREKPTHVEIAMSPKVFAVGDVEYAREVAYAGIYVGEKCICVIRAILPDFPDGPEKPTGRIRLPIPLWVEPGRSPTDGYDVDPISKWVTREEALELASSFVNELLCCRHELRTRDEKEPVVMQDTRGDD